VTHTITVGRQRVPLVDAATLEDRTRPALDRPGLGIARMRYASWRKRRDEPADSQRSGSAFRPGFDRR
jgi:hypothetical protein